MGTSNEQASSVHAESEHLPEREAPIMLTPFEAQPLRGSLPVCRVLPPRPESA